MRCAVRHSGIGSRNYGVFSTFQITNRPIRIQILFQYFTEVVFREWFTNTHRKTVIARVRHYRVVGITARDEYRQAGADARISAMISLPPRPPGTDVPQNLRASFFG
jgi:hypothetical protein